MTDGHSAVNESAVDIIFTQSVFIHEVQQDSFYTMTTGLITTQVHHPCDVFEVILTEVASQITSLRSKIPS